MKNNTSINTPSSIDLKRLFLSLRNTLNILDNAWNNVNIANAYPTIIHLYTYVSLIVPRSIIDANSVELPKLNGSSMRGHGVLKTYSTYIVRKIVGIKIHNNMYISFTILKNIENIIKRTRVLSNNLNHIFVKKPLFIVNKLLKHHN